MEALVEERTRGGSFQSLEDFSARIDPRQLNRRQLESLAGAGAFDAIKPDRATVFGAAETMLAHAASALEQKISGQAGLFGVNSAEAAPIRLPRDVSWSQAQRMAAERDAFGFYFSAHPVDSQRHLLAAQRARADVLGDQDRADHSGARPQRREVQPVVAVTVGGVGVDRARLARQRRAPVPAEPVP